MQSELIDFRPVGIGERYAFTTTADQTNGELVVMEVFLSPNSPWSGPPHLHPVQEEQYEVLSGTLDVMLDGKKQILREGERLVVPAGTSHTFGNYNAAEVHFISEHRPALRFQEMMEAWYAPVKEGRLDKANSLKGLIMYAAVAQNYTQEIVFANPALRVLQRVLAALGRALSYGQANSASSSVES